MDDEIEPCLLHDESKRVVYASRELYAMPQPHDHGTELHAWFDTVSASDGPDELRFFQFFGTLKGQTALELWARSHGLTRIEAAEYRRLAAQYEAEWRASKDA